MLILSVAIGFANNEKSRSQCLLPPMLLIINLPLQYQKIIPAILWLCAEIYINRFFFPAAFDVAILYLILTLINIVILIKNIVSKIACFVNSCFKRRFYLRGQFPLNSQKCSGWQLFFQLSIKTLNLFIYLFEDIILERGQKIRIRCTTCFRICLTDSLQIFLFVL